MNKTRRFIAKLSKKNANPFDPNADPFKLDYFERLGVKFVTVKAQNKTTARRIIKQRFNKRWILVEITAG
jgi:hypothetical protein